LCKSFLKICEARDIIVSLKRFVRENITKNWNATNLTKFYVKDVASTSNKVEKNKSKKIDANKLSSWINNASNKKSATKIIEIVVILRKLI